MSYVNKCLLPDEQVLFRTRKHLIIFYIPMVWACIAIGFLLTPNDLVHRFAYLPALLMIITGINQWLLYITAEFAVTNKRIIMREGFFFRHMNELRLSTISNITINQSLIGQLLGYGNAIINPFGGSSDVFSEISHPFDFQKAAQIQLDQITTPSWGGASPQQNTRT